MTLNSIAPKAIKSLRSTVIELTDENISISAIPDNDGKKILFSLIHDPIEIINGFMVQSSKKKNLLQCICSSVEERDLWIKDIKKTISECQTTRRERHRSDIISSSLLISGMNLQNVLKK